MAGTGIVLYHGIDSGAELSGYARMAEDAGFHSLWVTERYFHEETFSMLGYLAARTECIRLGVGVVNPYTRHPALLGMGAATLDRLSGGRMMLGLGRSDADVIAGRMGMEYRRAAVQASWHGRRTPPNVERRARDRGVRWRQSVQRRLGDSSRTGRASHISRRHRAESAQARGRSGRRGSPKRIRPRGVHSLGPRKKVRDAASNAGRDPRSIDITCMLIVRLTDDPDAMLPSLRERVARLIAEPFTGEALLGQGGFDTSILPSVRELVAAGDESGAARYVSEELAEACYLLGDVARCRERIQEYIDAGVDTPLLLPRLEGFARTVESLAPGETNDQ